MTHLSQEQLEALATGEAPLDDRDVRAHLKSCTECAGRLAREARFEEDLHDAVAGDAADVAVRRARPTAVRLWRIALPVAAALALVAFAVWHRAPQGGSAPVAPGRREVVAPLAVPPCLEDPMGLGPGRYETAPGDVCRWATTAGSDGPPS